jgi:hypothetical protein
VIRSQPEELEDLPAEFVEGLVIPVVDDVFVHQSPQPFNGIEMGDSRAEEGAARFALKRLKLTQARNRHISTRSFPAVSLVLQSEDAFACQVRSSCSRLFNQHPIVRKTGDKSLFAR